MMRTSPTARRPLRWLLLLACAGLGACSWLEAEFSTLDRLPPGWQVPVDGPRSALADRP